MGENTSYLRERVVAEFEKQRSLDEIAAFLPTVYHGGAGVVVDGEQYVAWMSTYGIRIAHGDAARYERDVQIISWETAAKRISELLDAGQYAGEWELERSTATERELLAQQISELPEEDKATTQLINELLDRFDNETSVDRTTAFMAVVDYLVKEESADITVERIAAMLMMLLEKILDEEKHGERE